MFTVNKNPTPKDLKKFGSAMIIGFGTLAIILWVLPWIRSGDSSVLDWTGMRNQWMAIVFVGLGVFLAVLGHGMPGIAQPVYVTWMTIATPIGLFMSTLALSVLYFLLLPVFAIIVRQSDPLRKKTEGKDSYWEDYKPYEPTMERLRRPF